MDDVLAQKKKIARELFQQGHSPSEVRQKLRDRYGKGLQNQFLFAIHREITGEPKRGTKSKAKKKGKSKPNGALVPIEVPQTLRPPTRAPSLPTQQVLKALVSSMQRDGIEAISIDARGKGRVFELVATEIEVEQ